MAARPADKYSQCKVRNLPEPWIVSFPIKRMDENTFLVGLRKGINVIMKF